jgi:hydrogenase maturation protease
MMEETSKVHAHAVPPVTLVLGVGNTLLSDESVGVRVIEYIGGEMTMAPGVELVDGGTMGLSLLPVMEEAANLIIVDAAILEDAPGTVCVYVGGEMDAFLRTRGRTPHDIGLDDLLDALRLRGRLPEARALVCIQPESISVGDSLSEAVAAAVPVAAHRVADLIRQWTGE